MTQPTASPELPDLGHLEALQRFGWCDIADRDFIERPDGEYVKLADVMALARRAKPEGEAPQAVAKFKIGDTVRTTDSFKRVGTIRRIDLTHLKAFNVVGDDGGGMFGAWELEHFTPAARHAESGAQAAPSDDEIRAIATEFDASMDAAKRWHFRDVIPFARALLAAQSQGAQATSIDGLPRYKLAPGDQREWMAPAADGAWCRFDHAAALAAKAEAPAPRTELSKRIREAATADVTLAQAKLLIGAAEEIERAQQAAAPGASIDTEEFATLLTEYVRANAVKYNDFRAAHLREKLVSYIDHAKLRATSAPGTPEAPADKHLPGWERGIATVTLTGHQLREALDFLNPDGDDDVDQRDNDLTFGIVQHKDDDGTTKTGLCCWNDDSDGVMPLDEYPRAAQLDGGQGEGEKV